MSPSPTITSRPAVGSDGTRLVVKAGVPDRELRSEIEALRALEGIGAARLLNSDPDEGVLLLERLEPGQTLEQVTHEATATAAAADVMGALHRPAPAKHPFPSVQDWAAGLERLRTRFDGGTGPFPRRLVEQAEDLFAALLGSMGEPVLLHGDLHHANILSAQRSPWLAIDPKGVIGEREYEPGAFLRNPLPQLLKQPRPERILSRRVGLLCERLSLDRQRVVGWGIAQAVLSAWWSFEDHGEGWEPCLEVARLLRRV